MKYTISLFTLLVIWASCSPANKESDRSEQPAQEAFSIYLVRHAEKDLEAGNDPPLTPEGQARAEKLASLLQEAGITAIFSSQTRRTLATAAPLAQQLNLEPIIYNPKEDPITLLPSFSNERNGGNILIVGHSNSIPATVNAYLGENRFEQLDESVYDKLFVVSRKADGTTIAEVRTLD